MARLTVRNVGSIVQILNDNTACGFESPDVKFDFTTEGEVGQQGTATWTVENCELDFSETPFVTSDCNGVQTAVSGRVVVSAKRILHGTLTGDTNQPVVPVHSQPVTIELTNVEFDHYTVESSDSDAVLNQVSGTLSAVARPRLGASASQGICMIPTPNIELAEIVYTDAKVHVAAEGRRFYVDVPSSRIGAVNGRVGEQENFLGGFVKVWGSDVQLPTDDDGLNPDYNPEQFQVGQRGLERRDEGREFELGHEMHEAGGPPLELFGSSLQI